MNISVPTGLWAAYKVSDAVAEGHLSLVKRLIYPVDVHYISTQTGFLFSEY